MTIIGVLSDTHGLLRDEAVALLRGSDHIIHAGDIGDPAIIPALRALAPVTAIRGNIDRADWAAAYPETAALRLFGLSILIVHDRKSLSLPGDAAGQDLVISGHSHRAAVERAGPTLFLNPGSAGPRRFSLPVTVARIACGPEGFDATIVTVAPHA